MKLLFVCTCLEPGRDGVGDYARLLAEACIDAGHSCALLSLNDELVAESHVQIQCDRHYEIECLRLAASQSWAERIGLAEAFADKFAPDWVSWQIVPYGFNPKGIIPPEVEALNALGKGRSVHVLLHELWIGLSRGESIKNRGWGVLQRRALRGLMSALEPAIIHTTNVTYQTVLAREGWHSELLPLFGNVPITEIVPTVSQSDRWIGAIFGTVHPQFSPIPCMDIILDGARASRRTLRLLGIGRLGTYGEELFAEMQRAYKGVIEVSVLGEKSPQEISRLLQTIDFGIATHPWALLGKSGVVAAMLDHGLPVIVPRDDWALRGTPIVVPPIDPLVFKISEMPPELMAGRLSRKRPPVQSLPAIAEVFLSSLGIMAASSPPEL